MAWSVVGVALMAYCLTLLITCTWALAQRRPEPFVDHALVVPMQVRVNKFVPPGPRTGARGSFVVMDESAASQLIPNLKRQNTFWLMRTIDRATSPELRYAGSVRFTTAKTGKRRTRVYFQFAGGSPPAAERGFDALFSQSKDDDDDRVQFDAYFLQAKENAGAEPDIQAAITVAPGLQERKQLGPIGADAEIKGTTRQQEQRLQQTNAVVQQEQQRFVTSGGPGPTTGQKEQKMVTSGGSGRETLNVRIYVVKYCNMLPKITRLNPTTNADETVDIVDPVRDLTHAVNADKIGSLRHLWRTITYGNLDIQIEIHPDVIEHRNADCRTGVAACATSDHPGATTCSASCDRLVNDYDQTILNSVGHTYDMGKRYDVLLVGEPILKCMPAFARSDGGPVFSLGWFRDGIVHELVHARYGFKHAGCLVGAWDVNVPAPPTQPGELDNEWVYHRLGRADATQYVKQGADGSCIMHRAAGNSLFFNVALAANLLKVCRAVLTIDASKLANGAWTQFELPARETSDANHALVVNASTGRTYYISYIKPYTLQAYDSLGDGVAGNAYVHITGTPTFFKYPDGIVGSWPGDLTSVCMLRVQPGATRPCDGGAFELNLLPPTRANFATLKLRVVRPKSTKV